MYWDGDEPKLLLPVLLHLLMHLLMHLVLLPMLMQMGPQVLDLKLYLHLHPLLLLLIPLLLMELLLLILQVAVKQMLLMSQRVPASDASLSHHVRTGLLVATRRATVRVRVAWTAGASRRHPHHEKTMREK